MGRSTSPEDTPTSTTATAVARWTTDGQRPSTRARGTTPRDEVATSCFSAPVVVAAASAASATASTTIAATSATITAASAAAAPSRVGRHDMLTRLVG